jgi:uncharacterized integral membrane protein (TIGR00698 family)
MAAARIALIAGVLISLAGLVTAPFALAAGITVGLILGNPWARLTGRASRVLLQTAVVGLGFGLALDEVWRAGATGLLLTLLVISAALILGIWLGRKLGVPERTASLIAAGTAICGGSAIAAIAPVLSASDEEVGAALATVFTLNALGLFLFPPLAFLMGLGQTEFGYWAALAIHDTSSVVAAGSVYGASALSVATTVKLTRAAFIAPLAVVWAWRKRAEARRPFPWFIAGFVAAILLRAATPTLNQLWDTVSAAARHLLILVLFLIGTGMTRNLLRNVGFRPLLQGLILWVVLATLVLLAVQTVPLPS